MASNKNYHFQLDFSNTVKDGNNIVWKNSIGSIIPFTSDVINGEFVIEKYIPKNTLNKNIYIILSFNNQELKPITTSSLRKGKVSGILHDYLWKYNIGDHIQTQEHDFVIIDRKMHNGLRSYKIKCNHCGYNCGSYYSLVDDQIYEEYWITERNVEKGCQCCKEQHKIIVQGINDVATTDPWLAEYLYNQDLIHKRSAQSGKSELMKCPFCGEIHKHTLGNVYRHKHLPCICNDSVSMPNKIAYATFKTIETEIQNYQREYSPKWAGRFRYDNYFIYNKTEYIVEMDGGLGHGNKTFCGDDDIDGLQRDKSKDELAISHDINIIRINCNNKSWEDIYDNLITALLKISSKFVFDEQEIMTRSRRNIIYDVCKYYIEVSSNLPNIAKNFNLSIGTVVRYLKFGRRYGWNDYVTLPEKRQNNLIQIVEYYNLYNSPVSELAAIFNLSPTTIVSYLKDGNKLNLCSYDAKKNMEDGKIKGREKAWNNTSKAVYVYHEDGLLFLGKYKSAGEIERCSMQDFGEYLSAKSINRVCIGERHHYKHRIFSYVELFND